MMRSLFFPGMLQRNKDLYFLIFIALENLLLADIFLANLSYCIENGKGAIDGSNDDVIDLKAMIINTFSYISQVI